MGFLAELGTEKSGVPSNTHAESRWGTKKPFGNRPRTTIQLSAKKLNANELRAENTKASFGAMFVLLEIQLMGKTAEQAVMKSTLLQAQRRGRMFVKMMEDSFLIQSWNVRQN